MFPSTRYPTPFSHWMPGLACLERNKILRSWQFAEQTPYVLAKDSRECLVELVNNIAPFQVIDMENVSQDVRNLVVHKAKILVFFKGTHITLYESVSLTRAVFDAKNYFAWGMRWVRCAMGILYPAPRSQITPSAGSILPWIIVLIKFSITCLGNLSIGTGEICTKILVWLMMKVLIESSISGIGGWHFPTQNQFCCLTWGALDPLEAAGLRWPQPPFCWPLRIPPGNTWIEEPTEPNLPPISNWFCQEQIGSCCLSSF